MQTKIENAALELFKQYGARSVSVDDIAQRTGISKNIIYEKYGSKEAFVLSTLRIHFDFIKDEINLIKTNCSNPVICIVKIYAFIIREISLAQPIFVYSIKKYFPEAAKAYQAFQEELLTDKFLPLYNSAKAKGMLRNDVNIYLLLELHKKHFDDLFSGNARKGKPKNYEALFKHTIINNLRGLLTKESYHILETEITLS